ncbi:MAG: M48 family metallopeptidase [Silicimonas sp.]|nr:M48 family metallopeptidase [Silicimonas sp.]
MRQLIALALLPFLAACDVPTTPAPGGASEPLPRVTRTGSAQTVSDFRAVAARVEPVAERACRSRTSSLNCDFRIIVDSRRELGANAYQTYGENGRPILGITPALIAEMRNRDEIAFVIGHEAAHHIEGHIGQTQTSATTGAILGNVLGAAIGLDPQGVELATNIGGTVGARRFSKGFELEADSLGAQIAEAAGYDAMRGVLYFMDADDPGDRFLGTHPPNGDRIRVVQRTVGR